MDVELSLAVAEDEGAVVITWMHLKRSNSWEILYLGLNLKNS